MKTMSDFLKNIYKFWGKKSIFGNSQISPNLWTDLVGAITFLEAVDMDYGLVAHLI